MRVMELRAETIYQGVERTMSDNVDDVTKGVTLRNGNSWYLSNNYKKPYSDSDSNSDIKFRLDNAEETDNFVVKYHGKTYDISGLLKYHPGGRKTLKPYKGFSLDRVLAETPHSKAAHHLFEEFVLENQSEYQDIEKLINWNKPILWQVSSLKNRYWEWVNLPVNRPIRLFKSNFLELLTITPWYLVPIIWIPISLYFFYIGCTTDISDSVVNSMPQIIIAFAWGLLLWTFLEYSLHRKLFHMKPPPDSTTLITLHFLLHGLHHKAPFDAQRLLFPPVPAIAAATILLNLYKLLFPPVMINFVISGTMIGYLCYDLIHYYLHYGAPKAETYLYVMKRYHNYHHFSHHQEGFGISSKLWDYVFGTLITLRQLIRAIEW
ncbi:fatty acid 2-hydroxylase isoform X2 [Cephus cinctus]|uniref:Fatty acid 2-hydroxylase n=1 Tax=Cephus cinctus TaxID=211228 RepID=A0AAJ7FKA3_CEPCN|nr:fatty acid 2-hydroxylase isoform X2 [Cephus cinctus]